MPTLKEVIADKAKYPDNLVWNMGDGTAVTLAQLRELSTVQQNAVSKAETDFAAKQAALDKDRSDFSKAQTNLASAYTLIQSATEAIKAGRLDDPSVKQLFGNTPVPNVNNNNNSDAFAVLARLEQDTLMGPVVAVIKKVREEAAAAQKSAADLVEVNKRMATNYLNGVLEDRYDRLVPADKQDKITLASLIQDAVKNAEFSSDSVPDIRKAYKRAIAGDVAAANEAAIRENERKKVLEELANNNGGRQDSIFVGQPQNFGLDVHNRSGKAPVAFKSLDEAFAAAEKDPTIWTQNLGA